MYRHSLLFDRVVRIAGRSPAVEQMLQDIEVPLFGCVHQRRPVVAADFATAIAFDSTNTSARQQSAVSGKQQPSKPNEERIAPLVTKLSGAVDLRVVAFGLHRYRGIREKCKS